MAISPRVVVRSTSCLVLRRDFRGRRIEWRYFRFRQIQDGGCAAILKIQMAISPRQIIRFTPRLVLGWGFRVADRMALYSGLTKFNRYVGENARGVVRLVTI